MFLGYFRKYFQLLEEKGPCFKKKKSAFFRLVDDCTAPKKKWNRCSKYFFDWFASGQGLLGAIQELTGFLSGGRRALTTSTCDADGTSAPTEASICEKIHASWARFETTVSLIKSSMSTDGQQCLNQTALSSFVQTVSPALPNIPNELSSHINANNSALTATEWFGATAKGIFSFEPSQHDDRSQASADVHHLFSWLSWALGFNFDIVVF